MIGVLVFAGLTAYDTQQIKEMYNVNDDGSVSGRKAVMGALRLYLDFINLFMMLLSLFGGRRYAAAATGTTTEAPASRRGLFFLQRLASTRRRPRSSARSTRARSWPRFRISPVAAITL